MGPEQAGLPDGIRHRGRPGHQDAPSGVRGRRMQGVHAHGVHARHRSVSRLLRAHARGPGERRDCGEEPENAHQIQGGGVQSAAGVWMYTLVTQKCQQRAAER